MSKTAKLNVLMNGLLVGVWQPGKKTAHVLIAILIIYTVLRNLPFEQIQSLLSPI